MNAANPAPRTQQQRSADSSRRLLRAAAELIAEKGFERTTAAEIGIRAGYSREMVRARYGTKADLLQSLLGTEYAALMYVAPTPGISGLDRAVAHIGRTREAADNQPVLLRAYYFLCFESLGASTDLRAWIQDWVVHYQDSLAQALRDGIADGSVSESIDPDATALETMTYGLGLAFRWLFNDGTDFHAGLREREATLRSLWARTRHR